MKSTFQVSHPGRVSEPRATGARKSPAIECSLQPSTPVRGGGSASFRRSPERSPRAPRLWALSQGFIEAEAKREYRLEAILFGVIVALAAWPIGVAFYIASQTVR